MTYTSYKSYKNKGERFEHNLLMPQCSIKDSNGKQKPLVIRAIEYGKIILSIKQEEIIMIRMKYKVNLKRIEDTEKKVQ